MMRNRHLRRHRPDYAIAAATFLLVLFGLAMLASASSNLGQDRFGDSYHYLKRQITYGLSVGVLGFLAGAWAPYRRYARLALPLLAVTIVLLLLVFTPLGVAAKGATRWLALGPVQFQPSELLKLTFVMYLAAWLSRRGERQRSFWGGFVPFLVVCGAVSGILLAQRSTSIVGILILTALVVYFVSGARLSHLLGFTSLALTGIALVVYLTPYRLERVASFLKGGADARGGGYHLEQAQRAIGAGSLTGVGYGESATKIRQLPEVIGDSIFAVIAEELGFVGVVVLLALFLFLVLRILLLARRSRDPFAQLLLVGFGAVIALQVFVHVAAISGLIPLTGTPLPFVSYGGTALAVFMTMMGITVNVSKYS